MLLGYGARNFFCFKEGVEVSLEVNANCPKEVTDGKSYVDAMCVKGANGSGKTNLLKILTFIASFSSHSFNKKPEDNINVCSYFENDDPIDFYIDFQLDEVRYHYELSLNQQRVISESITRKIDRATEIFRRENDDLVKCISEFKFLEQMKIRSNASLISTVNQYDLDSPSDEMKKIYGFFNRIFGNVYHYGLYETKPNVEDATKYYYDHPDVFKFVKEFICGSDIGINDIRIEEVDSESGKELYRPFFVYETGGREKILPYNVQSSGTKSLFVDLAWYKAALDVGGVLVADEFDINLHPDLLPHLVELFTDSEINIHKAQLIFTTHNSQIMDEMGKYRTVLLNKDQNESYAYRLDELPGDIVRNDRAIEPLYKAGKLGGVPKV